MPTWSEQSVQSIADAQSAALADRDGAEPAFLKIANAQAAPPPAPLAYVSDDAQEGWFRHVNDLPAEVGGLGCYRIFDCSLHRHGIMFHGDTLLTDGSHLGDVSLEEARQMSREDREATSAIALDRPALIFLAAGYRVYGHWLVDFLPRMRIARQALGSAFYDHVIPVPETTPAWAIAMLGQLCGVFEDQLFYYDATTQHLTFSSASVPTYAHANYHFHPHSAAYWPTIPADRSSRRLCISRLNFEGRTDGVLKNFVDRALFERMATDRGYELVYPERLSLRAQMEIFAEASHVIGEYGSALHNTLFSPTETVVGAIRCPNDVQLRISALKQQKTVLCMPQDDWVNEAGAQCYSTSEATLARFFEAMDDI